MLARKNRIVKKEDFARIKRYGRSYFSGNIELKIAENSLDETRIGFIVGLTFSKKAVERNAAKRWARESLRSYLPKLGKNKDLLIIIRKKDNQRTEKDQIKEDIRNVLKKPV